MSVCSQRTDTPGFFTTCLAACGGCRCGEEVRAEEREERT